MSSDMTEYLNQLARNSGSLSVMAAEMGSHSGESVSKPEGGPNAFLEKRDGLYGTDHIC